jgi:tRNA pseudouridine38-40 synthase
MFLNYSQYEHYPIILFYHFHRLRYFIDISYSGTSYHGWQEQKNARGIQEVINDSLSLLLKTTTKLIGSGRTDTGVHARQQVAHFEISDPVNCEKLCHRLNRFLPHDIAINRIFPVNDKAHARFSAISRTYEYWITSAKDPFLTDRAWLLQVPLDIEILNKVATILTEYNDFESFSRVKTDVNHFRCKLLSSVWTREGTLIKYTICADRFLRGMVRTVVGTMVDIAKEKITLEEFREIIEIKDRRKAGAASPAEGLYLVKVEYPGDIFAGL